MKGMQKIKRGSGFKGAIDYALDRDGEKSGQIIGGNMSGENSKELSSEFRIARSMRPDVKKPVWHNTLRLLSGERLSPEKWVEVADDYMNKMGFTDEHQRVYVLHDDQEGQHIHIISSRIGLDGSLYYGQNENLASTQYIYALEREHGLTISPELPSDIGGPRRLSKGEIEMAIRTGEAPSKLILQNAIGVALADKPTTAAFIERLEAAGVGVRPNIASTGTMNGFSFEWDGIAFSASKLDKSYSWKQLKKGLDYEQTRDREILERTKEQSNQRADQRAAELAEQQRREPGPTVGTAGAEPGDAQRRGAGIHHGDRPRVGQTTEDERRAMAVGGGQVERRDELIEQRTQSPGVSGRPDHDQHGQGQPTVARGDLARLDSSPDRQPAAVAGADQRIHDLAAPAVDSRKESGPILQRDQSSGSAEDPGNRQRQQPVAPHIAAKQHAWRQQHEALDAPAYRLTLTARRENLQTFNLGKGKGSDGQEKFYTADEVNDLLPQLSRHNARGYDIYVTPISDHHHYIVLDDTDPDRLKGMQAKTGILPVLVQESSPGNLQAIICANKHLGQHEQSNANYLVQTLNKAYGDPKFTGVVHPFRLSGFMNQKPVYERQGKRPIVRPRPVVTLTRGADPTLDAMLQKQRDQQVEQIQRRRSQERTQRIEVFKTNGRESSIDARYHEIAQRIVGHVDKQGWPRDWSRIDYAVACELLKQDYYSEGQIVDAIKENSPGVDDRKQDPDYYAQQTVKKALQNPEVQQDLQHQLEQKIEPGLLRRRGKCV